MTASPPPAPDLGLPADPGFAADLAAIEAVAVDLAQQAGAILVDRFRSAMEITFKDRRAHDPVTEVDHAVEALVREAVQARFPDHAFLGEEGADGGPPGADFVWIVDPLDGTSNFINGLPLFACSIGVAWRGTPVVGAIFLPATRALEPGVYHGRAGGGVRFNGRPFQFETASLQSAARLSGMPGGTAGVSGPAGRRFGVARTLGSIAAELVCTAEGTFQMAFFAGARVWDVAAGVVLCQEAGAAVWVRGPGERRWRTFRRFTAATIPVPTPADLRAWNETMGAGDPTLLPALADDLVRAQGLRAMLLRALRRGNA